MSRHRGRLLLAAALLLLPPAACSEQRAGAAVGDERLIASAAGPIELTEGPLRIALDPLGERTLSAELDSLGGRRVYLVLRDLRAAGAPGVLYHLYLDLPAGAEPGADDSHHVGILNFFGAPPLDEAGETPREAAALRSFDVSEAARALRERDLPTGPTTVTIRPQGRPTPGARPVIGRIELLVQ